MSRATADAASAWLARLIGCRTPNPGGDEPALCRLLADALRDRGADEVAVEEIPRDGDTGAYVYARFGARPRILVNVHIDTVPVNRGWTRAPFEAHDDGERVFGLGAADTKGAAAAILCALERERPDGVAVVFSGDEEVAGTCMRAFVDSPRAAGLELALVSEPTSCRPGTLHRGIVAIRAEVACAGGHSSRADYQPKPIVALCRLGVELDRIAERWIDRGPPGMTGLCMNVAGLEGGVAFNVIPERAALTFSFRPPPGTDREALDRDLIEAVALATPEAGPAIQLVREIDRSPFATADADRFRPLLDGAADLDQALGLDFWTEAAVLSAAGIDAVVIGPGDIAQAHAADEHVPRADLAWAVDTYAALFARTRQGQA